MLDQLIISQNEQEIFNYLYKFLEDLMNKKQKNENIFYFFLKIIGFLLFENKPYAAKSFAESK